MHNYLRYHPKEEIPEETRREAECCPVMAIFHDVERVSIEVNVAIEIHFVESLHGNFLLAFIPCPILLSLETDIMLYRPSGKFSFLVHTRRESRSQGPEHNEDGQKQGYHKKHPREKAPSNLQGEIARNDKQQGDKKCIVEAFRSGAVGR